MRILAYGMVVALNAVGVYVLLFRQRFALAHATAASSCAAATCKPGTAGELGRRTVVVEMVADVVCPYCYIGLHRLQTAIAKAQGLGLPVDIQIVYKPFILRRHLPKGGVEKMQVFKRQFGSEEQALRVFEGVKQNAAADGLCYDMHGQRAGNSEDAHRLLLWARRSGKELQLLQRVMMAYNCERSWLGDHDVLESCAVDVGLTADEVRQVLTNESFGLEDLELSLKHASELGVSGVPFFVIDGTVVRSGAVLAEEFVSYFRSVVERTT